MSFKDKPLKKIVADTRVTIDALHNDIIEGYSNNKKELDESKEELEKILEEGDDIERVKLLKKNIENCEKKKRDEVNYYLNTSDLLNEYYSKKDGHVVEKNVEMSVIDFMNKNNNKTDSYDLINKYMVEIDDNILPEKTILNIDV